METSEHTYEGIVKTLKMVRCQPLWSQWVNYIRSSRLTNQLQRELHWKAQEKKFRPIEWLVNQFKIFYYKWY